METQTIPVRIVETNGDKSSSGNVQARFWNKKERTVRALKFGGACWAAAIVSIIFPLVHFVLVPGFFLAGPILAFLVLGQESVILGGEGVCPHCQAKLPVARTSYRFPFQELCSACQSPLSIDRIEKDDDVRKQPESSSDSL